MTGPVSMYAIAEMNKRAEEITLKIRGELFRIGCAPNRLKVLRQGSYLQLSYGQQIILAEPYEALITLKKTPVGVGEAEVWQRLSKTARQTRQQNLSKGDWVVGIGALLLLLGGLLFISLRP